MTTTARTRVSGTLSIARGIPLGEEPGIGALTIPGYLREVCQRFPEAEALVFHGADGVVRWSYADLWQGALDVARALIAGGIGRDSRVGVLMTNRPEFLAAVFGTALAGGVFVPLNTFATPGELEHMVEVSGITALLFERRIAGKDYAAILADLEPGIASALPGALRSPRMPQLRRIVMLDDDGGETGTRAVERWADFMASGAAICPALVESIAAATRPADTASIFFSSGTTATPKGIVHNHRAICLQWWRGPSFYTDGRDVRIWTANGFFWSGPFALIIGNAFSVGGAIVLQSTFDPAEALALFQAERVTVPIARRHQWARIEALPGYATADLSSFRCFDAKLFLQNIQPTIRQDWKMSRAFGTTETLTIIAIVPPNAPPEEAGASLGPPLPGNVFKIVDPMTGEVVPLGSHGELAIKGPTLMTGYLGKTADESFDENGFYRTGDDCWLDERGNLHWDGRLTDMIKTGGANVAPSEVDLAIAAFPGVRMTQTVGVPDDLLSERMVACIVPQDGTTIDETALRAFLKQRLASYKLPKDILLFREDEMALTGSGAKVKANEMRGRAMQRLGIEERPAE